MIMIAICFLILGIYLMFPRPSTQIKNTYHAIVVLGCKAKDDGTPSSDLKKRLDHAVALYRNKVSSTIIVSGNAVSNQYKECDIMKQYLVRCGIEADIILEDQARNTFENMKYSHMLCPKEPVIIVTSPSHKRRASFFARKFFKSYTVSSAQLPDPLHYYLWEYTRMWVALYYEIALKMRKP